MKEYIETKLIEVENIISFINDDERTPRNINSYYYFLGMKNALVDLLDKCNEAIYSFHQDDDDDDEPWEVLDEWFTYNDDLAWYKQQEIDDMYNKHYHYSWWIGKNVMNTDSMWFTSDEIEAFRVIWQRRISHEE